MSLETLKWEGDARLWVEGYDAEAVTHHGNLFLLGNGAYGCRGTLEEDGAEAKVGIMIAGLYDRAGAAWREPVNAPNPFLMRIYINGTLLDMQTSAVAAHKQGLDIAGALHFRETHYQQNEAKLTLCSERFLSAETLGIFASRCTLAVEGQATLRIETGIDTEVWDLNGPHLHDIESQCVEGQLVVNARTGERSERICVRESTQMQASVATADCRVNGNLRSWEIDVDGRADFCLDKLAAIATSFELPGAQVGAAAETLLATAARAGYDTLKAQHARIWAQRWERCGLQLQGEPMAQRALRYSLYQLLSAAPFHTDKLSIPARALSGQVYKGAIFWDTELFMLPFFLYTFPEVARNLVRYRIHTLPGAMAKAREYGYAGAFYPWEGQEGGYDACTLFNVTDVFTGRPIRTYFRDKQVHVSADVAWAIHQYVQVSGDTSILWEGGLQVMLECCRFFLSYAHQTADGTQFVILEVTGPDEYHERVHNNAYTNHLIHAVVQATLNYVEVLKTTAPERFAQTLAQLNVADSTLERIADFRDRLYLPMADETTQVIAQFDGYRELEDCELATLQARKLHPNEYFGGGCGLATQTQIIKQADVVLLMHLLAERFSVAVKDANWRYYEPRTEHGSSLSACAYAMVAAETGRPDFAWRYFHKTATIDLSGSSKQYVGTLYIGGTHPAANGGAWMVVAFGFLGLHPSDAILTFRPRLPAQLSQIHLPMTWRGLRFRLQLTATHLTLNADADNASALKWLCAGQPYTTAPGAHMRLAYT